MVRILHLAVGGKDLFAGTKGRSERGGRSIAIWHLHRRGLLSRDEITQEGRGAIRVYRALQQMRARRAGVHGLRRGGLREAGLGPCGRDATLVT